MKGGGGGGGGGIVETASDTLSRRQANYSLDVVQLHPIYWSEEMERDGRQLAFRPLAQ